MCEILKCRPFILIHSHFFLFSVAGGTTNLVIFVKKSWRKLNWIELQVSLTLPLLLPPSPSRLLPRRDPGRRKIVCQEFKRGCLSSDEETPWNCPSNEQKLEWSAGPTRAILEILDHFNEIYGALSGRLQLIVGHGVTSLSLISATRTNRFKTLQISPRSSL